MQTIRFCILCLAIGSIAGAQSDKEQPANVAGRWQVTWQVRLGTARGTLVLKQDGSTLTGTFEQTQVSSALSGSIQGKNIQFDIRFEGKRPYIIAFAGTVDGDKISGKSGAKDVEGAGAYLGHGGEVVQPDHPWTATRQPAPRESLAKRSEQ